MKDGSTVTVVSDARGIARQLRTPRYSLTVTRGPSKGAQLVTAAQRTLIGRERGAQLVLEDPTVSALHCELRSDLDGLRVLDLGSRNGVRLGTRRVNDAWLESGDTLTLGASAVTFQLVSGAGEEALSERTSFGGLRGSSLRMRQLYAQLEACAASSATLLLRGESGTGKELAARGVVAAGARATQPFVVVDCGCLPGELAESVLFGHEPGAFTGATQRHLGAFERAHGGTVFLDEVGELPLPLQAKLLGVLERRRFTRVGGTEELEVDVRVIAATHRPLEQEVNRGGFRADLYYRLSVLTVTLPALREHREDIPELVGELLRGSGGAVPPDVLQRLYRAEYPGNVRELRNAVERARLGFAPEEPGPPDDPVLEIDLSVPLSTQKAQLVADFERAYVRAALAAARGNVSEAARRAGVTRQHLHDLLRKHGGDR